MLLRLPTSEPLGVVLDRSKDRASLSSQAAVDDRVAGQEISHGGRVEVPPCVDSRWVRETWINPTHSHTGKTNKQASQPKQTNKQNACDIAAQDKHRLIFHLQHVNNICFIRTGRVRLELDFCIKPVGISLTSCSDSAHLRKCPRWTGGTQTGIGPGPPAPPQPAPECPSAETEIHITQSGMLSLHKNMHKIT